MLLQCKLTCCLAWLLPALVLGLDLNEIDKSLSPRLVGMIYNLYKPTISTKRPPIIVDCDHPGVLCQFGTKPVVARPISECNCKDNKVPIVTGLVSEEQSHNEENGESVAPKLPDESNIVPIYKGDVDMEAILKAGESSYTLRNKQADKSTNKWSSTNSEDLYEKRFGEIPKKYASYYPFSKPILIDDPEEFEPDGPPPFFHEMFGPDKHHPFPPFKHNYNGPPPPPKPPGSWKPPPRSTPTTTKRPYKVNGTAPTSPASANTNDKESAKKA